MQRRTWLGRAAGLGLSLGATGWPRHARAQDWPDRPVKILQGFAVGGNADAVARAVSVELSRVLEQPLVVEAQPGAGSSLASATVARAKPDGYTALLATGAHTVAGALYEKLPYDTVTSFEMVSTLTFFPFVIVTSASSRFTTLATLLTAAAAEPGRINYGSAGVGSTNHLAAELLCKMSKTQMQHIPYRGASAALAPVISGEVDFLVTPAAAVLGNLKGGKLRALAVTGPQRWAGLAQTPTVAEQGVPDFDVRSWAGLMLPAGTPRAVVDRLHAATQQVLQLPSLRAKLEALGGEPRGSTPAEMKALVSADLRRWQQVVKDAKIPREQA